MQSIKKKPIKRLAFIPMRRKQKMRNACSALRGLVNQWSIARRIAIAEEISQ